MEPRLETPWPEWGCAFQGPETYQERWHRGPVLVRWGDTTVIQCATCLLNHVVPLPEADTLRVYYQSVFYQRSQPAYVARYDEDREWWTWVHDQTLAAAEQVLGSPGRVLDVGTGPGIFLDVAHGRDWETSGLELNLDLANRAIGRGHEIYQITLAECLDVRGDLTFDLLHLYEVLEHVPDPQECLLQAAELLAPGGLVHVVVPNDFNPLQLRAREALGLGWWWVAPPEHLTYFTPKMLQLLVRRCGFELLDLRTTYPLENFLLMGINYVADARVGRMCHQERMRYELAYAEAGLSHVLREYGRVNLQVGIGRELVCTARKRP